jgi:hypothetical protein
MICQFLNFFKYNGYFKFKKYSKFEKFVKNNLTLIYVWNNVCLK